MNFDYTEEQTLLENMVTSFVRDDYDWDTRCSIVKTEEGWKEENWKKFAELGLLGVPFEEDHGGLGGEATERPVTFPEMHATLYHSLGIDVNTATVNDLNGRPRFLVANNAQPIQEVIQLQLDSAFR